MKLPRLIASLLLMVGILLNLTVMPVPAVPIAAAQEGVAEIVDDFESGLPGGTDGDGLAIDAGDDSVCPTTDQRGVVRPQGEACDIGSYELEQ